MSVVKIVASKLHLKEHIQKQHRTKHAIEPFPCSLCGLVFLDFPLLKEHREKFHEENNESGATVCKQCDLNFRTLLELEWHEETELCQTKENYECQRCVHIAASENELEMHIVNEHTFPCCICKKVFTSM